jgi:hypothetical protein
LAHFIQIARDGEETFRAEEPSIGDFGQPARTQRLRKISARGLDGVGMIDRPIALAAPGFVISRKHSYPLKQRGFAGAVFTDNDRDRPVETQLEVVVQERKAERIGRAVVDARWLEPDAPEIRRRHIDRSISS